MLIPSTFSFLVRRIINTPKLVQLYKFTNFFLDFMEEADEHRLHPPAPSDGPSTSSVSTSQVQAEEGRNGLQNEDNSEPQNNHPPFSSSVLSYRVNISLSEMAPNQMKDDIWSCLVVLVTFWFFASMTLILGFYGSESWQLGPNSSRLIKINPFFVQSIKAQQEEDPKTGPMLYGFYKPPPLDVEINWNETHNTTVPIDFHKEWVYYLNKGSKVDIFYSIKSPSSSPLSLVIAQGTESLFQWIDEPSYPNSTLSWNIILGSGKIEQEIPESSNYYIAVGNLNSRDVEVELRFAMKALIYNTTQAYYTCSLGHHLCNFKLILLRTSAAVVTSPGPKVGGLEADWHVKVSYGPRWITYFIGSGIMTIIILSILRFCNSFQDSREEIRSERAPLLSPKDDDMSSWGSSYDSISHDEQDLDELLATNSFDVKSVAEGENLNRLCVICFDAPRDCFFLPCGHCAACFTCGTRIAEEAGTCPICRRSMKKVRKIFTV